MSKTLIPTYREFLQEFDANEVVQHAMVGDVISFLAMESTFKMSIDENVETDIRAGITFRMPPGQSFSRLRFRETAGATGSIRFVVAKGDVYDARSSISGSVSVQNSAAPNDELQVETKAGTRLAVVNEDLTTNDGHKAPFKNWDNPSFWEWTPVAGSSNTEIVTAAANTNGILIYRLNILTGALHGHGCRFTVNNGGGDKIILGSTTSTIWVGSDFNLSLEMVKIPAGYNLEFDTTHSDFRGMAIYQVL